MKPLARLSILPMVAVNTFLISTMDLPRLSVLMWSRTLAQIVLETLSTAMRISV